MKDVLSEPGHAPIARIKNFSQRVCTNLVSSKSLPCLNSSLMIIQTLPTSLSNEQFSLLFLLFCPILHTVPLSKRLKRCLIDPLFEPPFMIWASYGDLSCAYMNLAFLLLLVSCSSYYCIISPAIRTNEG